MYRFKKAFSQALTLSTTLLFSIVLPSSCGRYVFSRIAEAQNKPQKNSRSINAGPRIVFEHEQYDAGICERGVKIAHKFELKNQGNETLKIKGLKRSCVCTATVLSAKEIPPGGRGAIEISVASSKGGKQLAQVFVVSNDPRGKIVLSLSATIRIGVLLNPSIMDFGDVKSDETIKGTLRVSNISDRIDWNFEIQDVRSSSDLLSAHVIKGSRTVTVREYDGLRAETYEIEVELAPAGYVGRFEAKLEIAIKPDELFEIPVRAHVKGNITILPTDRVFFGFVSKGRPVSRKLKIINNNGKELRILSLTCSSDDVSTSLHVLKEGKEFELKVSLTPGSDSKRVTAQVVVETNDVIQPKINIPVYALIR